MTNKILVFFRPVSVQQIVPTSSDSIADIRAIQPPRYARMTFSVKTYWTLYRALILAGILFLSGLRQV